MSKPTPCALTPQQNNLWDQTRTAMIWHAPMFAHIFYTLLNPKGTELLATFTKDIPTAATDGTCLLINPDHFFSHTLNERIFICCHEILHCIFNHMPLMHSFRRRGKVTYDDGTELPYLHEAMNIAMDLVINDVLIDSGVGKFNKAWCHDTTLGTLNDSVIDVYRKLFKDAPQKGSGSSKPCKGGKGGSGPGDPTLPGGVRFDEHLDPGAVEEKDPDQASAERNEDEWATGVAAGMASAKAQGKMPAGLERLFNEILFPKVDWREHIQGLFARKVGRGGYDWRRLDRRLIVRGIGAPGKIGYGCTLVVIGVDTSGSITPKVLDDFFAEMTGILDDCTPERGIEVVWCDAAVHRIDHAEDAGDLAGIRSKGAPGGGGTDFRPVFDAISQMSATPDCLVYLTDGYGSFPDTAPKYPVIWGSISKGVNYPFGDVVEIPQ